MKNGSDELKLWDLFEIIFRHRWLIILPLCASSLVGLYLSFALPKIYQASTLILVQPQKIANDFVRSVLIEDAEAKVNTISQQILSWNNLERIVFDLKLNAGKANDFDFIESQVNRLKNNTIVEMTDNAKSSDAFTISYKDTDPQWAMTITNAIANQFINANVKARETSAIGTSSFLAEELENTRGRLREMEASLKEYRQRYMGELPEQLDSNLTILQRLQEQLNSKEDRLRSVRLGISMVEKQIEDSKQMGNFSDLDDKSINEILEMETTNPEVLKEQLANLKTRYTENHPDVRNLKNKIAQLELQNKLNGVQSSFQQGLYNTPLGLQRAELIREKSALEASIFDIQREIASYQKRVENAPNREQELVTLRRDYDHLSEIYKSLLNRKLEAEMSVSLERQQNNDQFKILDSARLPKKPIEPNLMKLLIMSIALGLGIGAFLIFAIEYSRNTYRKPDEIETDINLPVIATIPPILTPRDVLKKRIEMAMCGFFTVMTFATIFVFVFVARSGTDQTLETVRNLLNT